MKFLKYVGPLIAYAVYIFFSGSIRDDSLPGGMSDKTAHFLAFGFMVLPALVAVNYLLPRLRPALRVASAVATASVLGALLEVWQMLFPWRDTELLDWVADTAGALAAGIVMLVVVTMMPRKRQD